MEAASKMNASNQSHSSLTEDILQITGTSVNLVLGMPINSFILWLILTGPAGTVASDFFALNLSVCEILFILFSLICLIRTNPLFDTFTDGFLYTGRPFFQSCICVERFMAVVHPVLFLKYKPLRYRVACSVLAWLVIIGVSLIYMLVLGVDTMLAHFFYTSECLLFMAVMLLCSLAILRVLKQPAPGETGRERDNSKKRRAFTIICLTMVTFVGTYLIWSIVVPICAVLRHSEVHLIQHIGVCITLMTGFLHQLLYLCQKTGKLPCFKPVQGA